MHVHTLSPRGVSTLIRCSPGVDRIGSSPPKPARFPAHLTCALVSNPLPAHGARLFQAERPSPTRDPDFCLPSAPHPVGLRASRPTARGGVAPRRERTDR